MSSHKNLRVYQESMDYVTKIYEITKTYPNSELFGLTSQTRRACVSIPLNISEGASRGSTKDFCRFLRYSLSSTSEIDTALTIAKNIELIDEKQLNELIIDLVSLRKKLMALINSLEKKLSG
ncbi:four helix bundle protein [Luteibaculum oceani]|uniref:Four helix bundle protein n=1 Tax=Luteibaculum oceani TaxID=1294296 RepID=A0A5C6V9J8_9FLAO|nr:four helix bundle protein [Luteibaculum oceani]TXC81420.1 four helix bundle protein [Luteibaculum oceani]